MGDFRKQPAPHRRGMGTRWLMLIRARVGGSGSLAHALTVLLARNMTLCEDRAASVDPIITLRVRDTSSLLACKELRRPTEHPIISACSMAVQRASCLLVLVYLPSCLCYG